MPDIVNFVAVSGDYAYFGMAADPAAQVAAFQAVTPHAIDLVAGWIMPPPVRADVRDRIKGALRRVRHRGDWFEVPQDQAVELLARYAEALGGRPWRVRKRPLPTEVSDNAHHRPVVTPQGTFPTTSAAAAAVGISRQAAWDRAVRRAMGWRFEDDTGPPPPRPRIGRPPN